MLIIVSNIENVPKDGGIFGHMNNNLIKRQSKVSKLEQIMAGFT